MNFSVPQRANVPAFLLLGLLQVFLKMTMGVGGTPFERSSAGTYSHRTSETGGCTLSWQGRRADTCCAPKVYRLCSWTWLGSHRQMAEATRRIPEGEPISGMEDAGLPVLTYSIGYVGTSGVPRPLWAVIVLLRKLKAPCLCFWFDTCSSG